MSSSHLIRIDLGEACPTSPRMSQGLTLEATGLEKRAKESKRQPHIRKENYD